MYELLEHQSEVGVRASGSTLEDAFCEASKALFSIMTDTEKVGDYEIASINVEAANIEELFAALMNELIYMSSINSAFYSEFDYHIESKDKRIILAGSIRGEKIDEIKHELRTEVKAATYSGLKVWEENNNKFVQIIVDV